MTNRLLLIASTVTLGGAFPSTAAPILRITEAMSSGDTADWFEVTNFGDAAADISNFRMDDSSYANASSLLLAGVTSIAPGESVVFVEGSAVTPTSNVATFKTNWGLGATVQVGGYGGSGAGLSSTADGVTLFTDTTANGGTELSGPFSGLIRISFGAATAGTSFKWTYDAAGNITSATSGQLTTSGTSWINVAQAMLGTPGLIPTVSPVVTAIDLTTYVRVGRYDLPEPTRTALPPGTASHNLLCQEASGVAYNWDTDTLFIACDGGRSITQVSKTGQLIDTMTLALGGSPQGTDFYDIEGITYIGGGQFVMSEERDRQIVKFTYAAGTTLGRAGAQTVDLGTFDDNTGTEGLSYDPQTGGYICLKEKSPLGVFQTNVDFALGTATNGSPATVNSVNLFDTTLLGMTDTADVFAFSNLPSMVGQPQAGNLLVIGQENARVVNISRTGVIHSTLQIVADQGSAISAPDQQHEGITMDRAGNIYVVNENGGGNINFPQLWVYAPSAVANAAPTAVALNNQVNSIQENTGTTSPLKVADIFITDDGLGTNNLTVSGADAGSFEITAGALFIKAGVVLDYETKTTYNVTVNVDDASLGGTPDASVNFTLSVTDQVVETPAVPSLVISEVAPWSSTNGLGVLADWFEVTNTGTAAVDITGWKVDDNSNSFGSALALTGVTSIAPGESVIFLESTALNQATIANSFKTLWFAANPPAGLQVGTYTGSGIGLSSSGDAVNLYNAVGALQANVTFAASPAGPVFASFNNGVGINNAAISRLSVVGVHGSLRAAGDSNEIGSPGTTGKLFVSEVAPWGSGATAYVADWFELTNAGARAVDITGWKNDDNSNAFIGASALNGITTIAPGESVIFMETPTAGDLPAKAALFRTSWFGASPPVGLQIGSYSGSGGLSTGGDSVNIFDATGARVTGVTVGASTTGVSFDNKVGIGSTVLPLPIVSTFSIVGTNGAFVAANAAETGSPGTTGKLLVTEVAPWSSTNGLGLSADWFEVTNSGGTAVDITGWKMDDNSESPAGALALNGVSIIAPGESVIFIESTAVTNPAATVIANFKTLWFGASPPAGLQIGTYEGPGVGLGSGGDAVNLFDTSSPTPVRRANVSFGASPAAPYGTFDNAAGVNVGAITLLSKPAVNGAFVAKNDVNEYGSPGAIANSGPVTSAFWLAAYGFTSGSDDSDGDTLNNLQEFAFGLNPRLSDNVANVTNVPGGILVSRGTPTIYSASTGSGQDFRVVFIRRRDAASAGITYIPQFSSDMVSGWESRTDLPVTIIATDGDYETVSVDYPFFSGGKKARFSRIGVSAP